ncbi:MAG: phosphatase PAP2 family protein [Actinomycetota bacterium]
MGRFLRTAAWTAAALAVGVASSSPRGREIDETLLKAMNAERGPASDAAFAAVTELGALAASGTAAVVLAAAGHRRAAARGAAAAGTAWLVGQGLKKLWDRPRPYHADPDGTRLLIGRPVATSWPSSHPMVLSAFSTVASRELGLGNGVRACLGALSITVGVSRSALGVHYPSDVAGGLLLGRAVGSAISSRP